MKWTQSKAAGGSAPSAQPLEPRLTVADLARRYSVSDWTVRDWLKRDLLRGSCRDGRWSTTWDAIFDFEGRLAPPRGLARERAKEPLFTVSDLAAHFRRKPETIRRRLRDQELTGCRIRGAWYADRDAVLAYERAQDRRRGSDDAV